MDLRSLSCIVDAVYDCVLSPERWRDFLVALSRCLHGTVPGVAVGGPGERWYACAISEERWLHLYDARYGSELVERTIERSLLGSAFEISRLASESLERWEFYADWMQPQRLRTGIGCLVPLEGASFVGIGVYRNPGAPDFETEDLALLEAFMPHLRRAVLLSSRMRGHDPTTGIAESVMDRLGIGVVVLDASGRVLEVNDTARRIARRDDGLKLSSERLCLRDTRARRRLEALVRGVARGDPVSGASAGGVIHVPREDGASAYEVMVAPAPAPRSWFEGFGALRARVLVLIRDAASISAPSLAHLESLYALTPAEARIAAALARGRSIDEIARSAQVSQQTVRNQLKTVFDKTETHRQAELVARIRAGLATLAPPLSPPPPGARTSSSRRWSRPAR